MVSMLSFDSKSIKTLLDDKNEKYFQSDYPIFYKNQIQKNGKSTKYYYRSAISNALKNNQIRAVELMIKYITKYQNSFVSFFMFKSNFAELLQKGLDMTEILRSNIFCYQLDFEEWPATHTDPGSYFKPYNESLFNLRGKYKKIFDIHDKNEGRKKGETEEKVYKISYQLNMLPILGEYITNAENGEKVFNNENVSLMHMCIDTDNFDLFEVPCIQQVIDYRWDTFALNLHMVGAIAHILYVIVMLLYVNTVYINDDVEHKLVYMVLLLVCSCYPFFYECR